MTYRQQLKAIKSLDVDKFVTAAECDYTFEFDSTDEEFDSIVKFAYNIFIISDIEQLTPRDIAAYINCLIVDKGKTIQEVITMNPHVFINEAISYIND